jgi:hypothetical protein
MSASQVYQQIHAMVQSCMDERVDASTCERITLFVTGIIGAHSASPARVAQAIHQMGLRNAKPESLERQVRRLENDPEFEASLCFHRFARTRLLLGRPQELRLIVDPTTQEDRVVMVSVAVWYRGRALPLAWAAWPANTPLKGEGFWARLATLLEAVAPLLPVGVPITWLADRAFGTPAFTDLLTAHGWHYVVRVQGQTRYQDGHGHTGRVDHLIRKRAKRAKLRGQAFKAAGWREVSVVVYWGRAHRSALCLVSDLKPAWYLIQLYRSRFGIEASFRDDKSAGWQWEQGQVRDLAHVERLLIAMAFATWVTVLVGNQVATRLLSQPPTGQRTTRPYDAKHGLFYLGLDELGCALLGPAILQLPMTFTDWSAPNWETQLTAQHVHAFIFHTQPCYASES